MWFYNVIYIIFAFFYKDINYDNISQYKWRVVLSNVISNITDVFKH